MRKRHSSERNAFIRNRTNPVVHASTSAYYEGYRVTLQKAFFIDADNCSLESNSPPISVRKTLPSIARKISSLSLTISSEPSLSFSSVTVTVANLCNRLRYSEHASAKNFSFNLPTTTNFIFSYHVKQIGYKRRNNGHDYSTDVKSFLFFCGFVSDATIYRSYPIAFLDILHIQTSRPKNAARTTAYIAAATAKLPVSTSLSAL